VSVAPVSGGGREWVLNKFNLTLPEASFQAEGQWGGVGRVQAKRTQLDFTFAAAKLWRVTRAIGL
jgi:hypothetical protein